MNFVLIAVCLLAGVLARKFELVPRDAHKAINAWIIYLALPAVTLKYVPRINWGSEMLLPAFAPVIVWTGAWLLYLLLKPVTGGNNKTRAALTLVSGLGNTSFIGFPLVAAYFGEDKLPIAVVADQVTFILLSTLGVFVAASNAGGGLSSGALFKRLLRFPMFIVFLIALVLPHFLDFNRIAPVLDKLAGTLIPLALFSVGLQLQLNGWQQQLKPLSAALSYKLLLAPVMVMLVALLLQIKGPVAQVSIFETAMAPMITAAVLASEYDLNPALANLIVGVGIPLSFITTLLWYKVVQYFF